MALAIIILGTILACIVLTLLFLLPSVIRDEMYLSTLVKVRAMPRTEAAAGRQHSHV